MLKHVLWTTPPMTIRGEFELVNAIDDAMITAVLIGTLDHLIPGGPSVSFLRTLWDAKEGTL